MPNLLKIVTKKDEVVDAAKSWATAPDMESSKRAKYRLLKEVGELLKLESE